MTAISRMFKLEDEDEEKYKHGYFQISSFLYDNSVSCNKLQF